MFEKLFQKLNIKKILLIFAGIFLVIFLSLIIIKNTLSYSIIEKNLSNYLGVKIEFENPKTTFDYKFNINLKAQKINVSDKNKTTKFIEIDNPEISFKPLGFIFKKANFKKLNAKNITVNIKRDEKGEIDILKSLKLKDFSFLEKQNIQLTRLDSKVNFIKINFKDNYKIKSEIALNLVNTDVEISKRKKMFQMYQAGTIDTFKDGKKQTANISLDINSKYPFYNFNSDDLFLNINLDNINLYIFNDFVKKYISKDIKTFEGNAKLVLKTTKDENDDDFQNLLITITNPVFKLSDDKTIQPFKKDVTIKTLFLFDRDKIDIKNLTASSNELSISSTGTITKPFSKKRSLDLKTKISKTELNNFLYFLPDNLIYYRPKGIPTLKKSDFHGIMDGSINLKLFPLDITGNLKVSDVHIPNYPKPFKQNDVNIIFMKDKMRVYTRVYTPENEYVIIDGISNLDDSLYGKYSVKSTQKIDLAFAKLYLVPIQQIIGFNIGPVPIMNISGYGNIDIKTQGTIQDAQIFGEFEAFSANAELEGLNTKLTNGNCKLVFDNRNLIFKKIQGKMEGADFQLSGIGNTKGEVNLDVTIENASVHNILKIFNTSLVTKPYVKLTKNIAAVSGKSGAKINLKGTISDWEDKDFLSKLALSGVFAFKNNKVILKNKLSAQKINGTLNFGQKQTGVFELFLNNSKIIAAFESKTPLTKIAANEDIDFKSVVYSNKIAFSDIFKELQKLDKYSPLLSGFKNIDFYSKFHIKSEGKISLDSPNFENIKNNGYIIGLNNTSKPQIKFNSGIIKLIDKKIAFENFDTTILEGHAKIRGNIYNYLSKSPDINLNIILDNLNLTGFDKFLPKIKITEGKLNHGKIIAKDNSLKLQSISIDCDNTPLFFNAVIKDIFKSKILEANFSTILNERAADNFINPNLVYPVKIKGEIPVKGSFKGKADNYTIDLTANIPKNSDLYFSGANLGDINHERQITGKIEVAGNRATMNNLRLIKYIANQNGKINPVTSLKMNGSVIQKPDGFYYDNFRVSTNSPLNVRVLNLIFKKSILKQGNFDCNLVLRGNSISPKVNGRMVLQDLDIPLYDTQINNIKVNMSDKIIDGEIFAKNNQSDIKILAKMQNNFKTPYIIENIDIHSNRLNIMEVLSSISPAPSKTDINKKTEMLLKPEDLIIKKGNFDFREVTFEKIKAENLNGSFNYKDNIFNLENTILDIAEGKFKTKGKYSLKSTKFNLNAEMENCDSNILTKEFLHLSDQIFGKVNGSITLSGKNLNSPDAIKNIKSEVNFSVNNGKMPKLGSLEYLLRAGNLIKNGILGLSLNNLIQVLTPYKTGEFEKISGNLTIKEGEIDNLEIMSQGKNLSLYLEGTYSILENFADIKIYGKLSQNISNALGAIGNASINQFINSITSRKSKTDENPELKEKLDKIPPIEIENPEPGFFKVKVLGDINKENYIKNFSWL